MSESKFNTGALEYEVGKVSFDELNLILNDWDDGYLAFSKGEKRLKDVIGKDIAELKDRVNGISGVEGYLMEIDLWKVWDAGIFEEVSIERENDGFLFQKWTLQTKNNGKGARCYWRFANTKRRNDKVPFGENELKSVEVVVPDTRMHIFITYCGVNNGQTDK
ncbi:MAG: hypothetical protein HQK96_20080 [Nitrospirae bacterium]|nr:hypothetical protein [Nitrospirota bacterium]